MKEEEAIPTAATEAILITGVIKAKQVRDNMAVDIPNAFMQNPLPRDGDKVMKTNIVQHLCDL